METSELRKKFLNFFHKRGHTLVPSDSLIPTGDPTLLFTSAGMVQFKKHFLGDKNRDSPHSGTVPLVRACSSQKCLRTTDIEKVGLTSRHLTFFEMLGNFSFGDYFKSEAIQWAWEFLTGECGLAPQRLYASIYTEDEESFALWKKILPESKIVRLGKESNFWNMGETGPCGPCSEILYDLGEEVGCGKSSCAPGCDCDRYIEVWNLVFTQYDKQAKDKLLPLPQKNIDTGMGLERLAVVVNGKASVFETDTFARLIEEIRKLLPPFSAIHLGEKQGQSPKTGTVPIRGQSLDSPSSSTLAERIIADHLRACVFLIADGILPSNEGRGYILRRLLRRALRQGWINGKRDPFLHQFAPTVCECFSQAYPELSQRGKNIQSVIETEEKNALQTIETGTRELEEEIKKEIPLHPPLLKGERGGFKLNLPGEKVFYIYDTFGLDKEIQRDIVRDWGGELVFSEEEFEKAKEEAQEISRKGWKGSGDVNLTVYSELQKKVKPTIFRGYETLELETEVLAILKASKEQIPLNPPLTKVDLKRVDSEPYLYSLCSMLNEGEEGEIVLAETPFYAESGGQVGDKGIIESIVHSPQSIVKRQKNSRLTTHDSQLFYAEVLDTQKPVEGIILHRLKVKRGRLKGGDKVFAKVDAELRWHTMRHHTATHLLHAALRKILGTQVTQAGSLVAPEKLRFDFTYPKALSAQQLAAIEQEVNSFILKNIPRKRTECSLQEARDHGALAFFGEKYGEKVFVVNYASASSEVCGGTHCNATGEIGFFKIVSESSVGAGVRRIEALAGKKALEFLQQQENLERAISEKLKCSFFEAPERIEKILAKQKELERENANLRNKGNFAGPETLAQKAKIYPVREKSPQATEVVRQDSWRTAFSNGVKIVVELVEAQDSKRLRESADLVRGKLGSGIVLLACENQEKISFVVSVSKDCAKQGFNAGKIARALAARVGGSGGGKETFAEGGSKQISNLKEVLSSFADEIVKIQ